MDSDHAGDRPHETRSHTGIIVLLNGTPIEWVSRKQPETSIAPAEAEIYAMREAVGVCRWIQWVAEEFGLEVKWPFELKTDSTQARSFQHNTCPASKLKTYFDLREKSVQELRDKGVVTSTYIKRQLNVADLLTHCLSGTKFKDMLNRIPNLQIHNLRWACVYNSICEFNLEFRVPDLFPK